MGVKRCLTFPLTQKRMVDKNLEHLVLAEDYANIEASKNGANNEQDVTNKCNQCMYTSNNAGHLRTHLKTHSGEKSNKCNLCDFASSQAGHLRRHLKTHSGEKSNKCIQSLDSSVIMHARIPVLLGNMRKDTEEKG